MNLTLRLSLLLIVSSAAASCDTDVGLLGRARAQAPGALAGFGGVAYEEFDPLPEGGSLADLRRLLPQLAGRGVALCMTWNSERIDDPERFEIVREAQALGIPVHPVLLLPEGSEADEDPASPRHAETGYFVNTSNYAAWIARSKQLMAVWRAHGFPPTTMVIDMEMRKRRLHRLSALTGSATDPLAVYGLLRSGIDRRRYAAAVAAFEAYAHDAHAQGFKLQLTTLLPMLDDYHDGDDSLRQAFGTPLPNDPRAIPYDVVSFQIHRTLYGERYVGLTPFFVYDYARAARALVGERAAVDVGLTHAGIASMAPVYANGDELRKDVEAALAAGIRRENVLVYSLLGMVAPGRGPLDRWLQPPHEIRIPPSDTMTGRSHLDWGLLDFLLP
jgi:hypothetical protein